jgi:membrane-associated phospholipid phosphatase
MATTRSAGRVHGPGRATLAGTTTQLLAGAALLGAAALAGLVFVHRPWPNRLDVWGDAALPASPSARWAQDLAHLGSLSALVVGVAAVFVIGIWRDWVRAFACAAAPLAAVLVVQDVAKPLVGRHLGLAGPTSYPSGTVAAVAALAVAATLVVPALLRPLVAAVGMAAVVGVAAAVVVLRWHYPTDALGGMAVGAGAVLLVDALAHLPWALAKGVRKVGVGRPTTEPTTERRRRPVPA